MTASPRSNGVALGFGAYLIWGLLPIYLQLLHRFPPGQIVAHRILWSMLLLVFVAASLGRMRSIAAAARVPRVAAMLLATALLIAANWLVYIWAVLNHHVLETSLGYFINPLVNVALGMLFLRERLRPVQGVAVGIALLGVLVMAIGQGGALWISFGLALTFGLYGLLRKIVAIDALGGLAVETTLLAPAALAYLVWTWPRGETLPMDAGAVALLASSGVVTTVPLLLFAAAAQRMRYSTLGLIQYIAPTIQFLSALLLFGETATRIHMITFALIWAGLALFAFDSIRAGREEPVTIPE